MLVSDVLSGKEIDVIGVTPDMTVEDAARTMTRHGIGAVLVLAGDRVLGIVSERDIVRGVARHHDTCLTMRVDELMTSPVVTCALNDSIDHIMELMTERRVRHLPVIDRGRLAGIVSIGDVVKQRISEIEHESEALKRYIVTG